MKSKFLFLFIAIAFIVNESSAQDKYEFLIIQIDNSTNKPDLFISIDGKEFIKERMEFGEQVKTYGNLNPLLLKAK